MYLVHGWIHPFLLFPADLVSVLGDLLFSEELLFVNTSIVKRSYFLPAFPSKCVDLVKNAL